MCTVWAVSVRRAASDIVGPALLMEGGRGSAVDIVVVTPGTSSFVRRVLGNGDVEHRRSSFFVLNKLCRRNMGMSFTLCCCRCSLVRSASASIAATAAACFCCGASASVPLLLLLLLLLLLVLLGVFFSPPRTLANLYVTTEM